jgi:glycerol-3-phosphate dehydrogenase
MKRDPRALAEPLWDLVVVGGGIHGACVAWEAVLRGLTVCLVEKGDFGAATSANTMKIVHGGLRYLQHADYRRMRESIRERRTLLRIAPHLVRPLPVVVPTHGHGWHGRQVLRAALLLNDLASHDRNAGLASGQHIPRGRTLSRRDCLRLVPGLASEVTGAALFHDAQVRNSERLLLAFLRSAAKAGAELANYVEVTALVADDCRGLRVMVTDHLTGEPHQLRARVVVNAAGPWAEQVLGRVGRPAHLGTPFAKAFNVVTRQLLPACAVALRTRHGSRDPDTLVRRDERLLFVVPWREQSLVGTWYQHHGAGPDEVRITEADVASLLQAVNDACPALALSLDDVRLVHTGLVPSAGTDAATGAPRLAKRGAIVDHATDGMAGMFTIIGVKYTTARLTAERAVDRVLERLGRRGPPSTSALVPLHGAEPDTLAGGEIDETAVGHGCAVPGGGVARLRRTYGSAYGEVLAHLAPAEDPADPAALLAAEVRHAIRDEMAHSLSDVVFRRTELGAAGRLEPQVLAAAAAEAGAELGWSAARRRQEIGAVDARFGVSR